MSNFSLGAGWDDKAQVNLVALKWINCDFDNLLKPTETWAAKKRKVFHDQGLYCISLLVCL
jgi:hypothetical protein